MHRIFACLLALALITGNAIAEPRVPANSVTKDQIIEVIAALERKIVSSGSMQDREVQAAYSVLATLHGALLTGATAEMALTATGPFAERQIKIIENAKKGLKLPRSE